MLYGHRQLCYDGRNRRFFKDINNGVDKQFDTSNFDKNDDRPLLMDKNKKVIGKFKDELGGKIISDFVLLKLKIMR